MKRSLTAALLLAPVSTVGAAQTVRPEPLRAGQPPILLVFDVHADPWNNALTAPQKLATYLTWIEDVHWLLDQTEPLGIPVGFNCSGPFLEVVASQGSAGPGAALLRRMYDDGGQIGSHSHTEHFVSAMNWIPYGYGSTTFAQAEQTWADSIAWLYAALDVAYGSALPAPIEEITNLKEYHLPIDNEDWAQDLHEQFGISVGAKGQSDFYEWYDHYVWNPHRPSRTNALEEDPSSFVTLVSIGRVIGLPPAQNQGVDMTIGSVKRQLLQLYVNWRRADRLGLPPRIWTWGFAAHFHDLYDDSPSRAAALDLVPWIERHLAQRLEPWTGSRVLRWTTHVGVAEAFAAWEAQNPGVSSFDYGASGIDWSQYPYLRPVAEELAGFSWQADIAPDPAVEAFHLRDAAGLDAVLLWSDRGRRLVDVSAWVGAPARVVGLESGMVQGTDPALVVARAEPVLVTERP